jgi:FkbM family methyltransferase
MSSVETPTVTLKNWPRTTIGLLRRLPSQTPGKARLARTLLKAIRESREVLVHASTGAKFVVPHLSEPIAFHLLVDGCYEPETEARILSSLSSGDVFVDVGANVGLFTVGAGRAVGPSGRVLAFEPSPFVFPYLRRNVQLNDLPNVEVLELALSDCERDRAPFYPAPHDHFGMGALAPQFNGESCLVRTRTLDEILEEKKIRRVAVLKVDVEGHELAVLRGARRLLERSESPIVIFEFCDWAEGRFPNATVGQAQQFLLDIGYRLWRLEDFRRERCELTTPIKHGAVMLIAARSGDR